jgi:hypothetical protein
MNQVGQIACVAAYLDSLKGSVESYSSMETVAHRALQWVRAFFPGPLSGICLLTGSWTTFALGYRQEGGITPLSSRMPTVPSGVAAGTLYIRGWSKEGVLSFLPILVSDLLACVEFGPSHLVDIISGVVIGVLCSACIERVTRQQVNEVLLEEPCDIRDVTTIDVEPLNSLSNESTLFVALVEMAKGLETLSGENNLSEASRQQVRRDRDFAYTASYILHFKNDKKQTSALLVWILNDFDQDVLLHIKQLRWYIRACEECSLLFKELWQASEDLEAKA